MKGLRSTPRIRINSSRSKFAHTRVPCIIALPFLLLFAYGFWNTQRTLLGKVDIWKRFGHPFSMSVKKNLEANPAPGNIETTAKLPVAWPSWNKSDSWTIQIKEMADCWRRKIPNKEERDSHGLVMLTCHGKAAQQRIQITEAVALAYHLGAMLLVPEVEEAKYEPASTFPELYSLPQFSRSLAHMVSVVSKIPDRYRNSTPVMLSFPVGFTSSMIASNLTINSTLDHVIAARPSFAPYLRINDSSASLSAIRCLTNFYAIDFGSDLSRLGSRMADRVREASVAVGGRFIAVDLTIDGPGPDCMVDRWLAMAGDQSNMSRLVELQVEYSNKCPMSILEVGQLLTALGYSKKTAIYLTLPEYRPELQPLLDLFPLTYTKEYTVPTFEEEQATKDRMMDTAVDFYVCMQADAFLPANPSQFSSAVIGQRILNGMKQLIPPSSTILHSNSTAAKSGAQEALLLQIHRENERSFWENVPWLTSPNGNREENCMCYDDSFNHTLEANNVTDSHNLNGSSGDLNGKHR